MSLAQMSVGLKMVGSLVVTAMSCTLNFLSHTYLDEVSVTFCPDEAGLDPELWGLGIKLVSIKLNFSTIFYLAYPGPPEMNLH